MLLAKKLIIACQCCFVLCLAGCADNPGSWPPEKLTQHVKESLVQQQMEMTDVTLTKKQEGVFEGTGTVAGGETLKLQVTQDPAAKRITWKAEGDRGSFLDGIYELK